MSDILRVKWTVTPAVAPEPQLHCRRCGCVRNFASSGKFRVNSNGKKTDAWLIYKCVICDSTWNRPLLERRLIGTIDSARLSAMQRNDTDLARAIACDIEGLKAEVESVETFKHVQVTKMVKDGDPAFCSGFEIELSVPYPVGIRLDRFLAEELCISRSRIQRVYTSGSIQINPDGPKVLRKPVRDGMRIRLSGDGMATCWSASVMQDPSDEVQQ